jgi:nucleoside-diphosphate-sugar epimerase
MSTNFEATQLLADVCRRVGVRRLVFASSCSVYGANSELMLNEGSWLNPVSLYGRTRIQSEECLLASRDRLEVVILRLATVFGLSARARLDLLVNTLTAHAIFNGRIRVFGGGQWRPNLHVQDAAEAFIAAATADDARVSGQIFNVGGEHANYTVLAVARMVAREVSGVEMEIHPDSADARDYRVSFEKIRHVLGFTPRRSVVDGIREVAAACRTGIIRGLADDAYHNARYLSAHGFEGSRARVAVSA